LTGKKGITGLIILEEAYKKLLPEMLDDFPAQVFMQDNARTHILGAITDWLKSQDYTVMDWPPYSPDLNPIEMVWKKIKNLVFKNHPELRAMTVGTEKVKNAIIFAVLEAWESLKQEFFFSLTASMPRRVKAVIKAHGGYTRY
jgi:transposase